MNSTDAALQAAQDARRDAAILTMQLIAVATTAVVSGTLSKGQLAERREIISRPYPGQR